jgi:hypothetical protein
MDVLNVDQVQFQIPQESIVSLNPFTTLQLLLKFSVNTMRFGIIMANVRHAKMDNIQIHQVNTVLDMPNQLNQL